MQYLKPVAALALVGLALTQMLSSGAIERPPGEFAPDTPEQSALDRAQPIHVGGFTLQPLAAYRIEARVLSIERYRADVGAGLSPIDFALGWGPMSDTDTLQHFKVTQGARFYTIYPDDDAIDLRTALRSSANVHLIPANDQVRAALLETRVGHIVELEGYLVRASRGDGFTWNTSLTRDDTGNGACELFYIRQVSQR